MNSCVLIFDCDFDCLLLTVRESAGMPTISRAGVIFSILHRCQSFGFFVFLLRDGSHGNVYGCDADLIPGISITSNWIHFFTWLVAGYRLLAGWVTYLRDCKLLRGLAQSARHISFPLRDCCCGIGFTLKWCLSVVCVCHILRGGPA